MEKKLEALNKDKLKQMILAMVEFLSREQLQQMDILIEQCLRESLEPGKMREVFKLPQDFVDKRRAEFQSLKRQIENGDLYLHIEEYEDYSSGYWDWVRDYYDEQGIGDKILSVIQFAKSCVDDRRYQEASRIYDWLWDMNIEGDIEDDSCIGLERMVEENLIQTDVKRLALLTLYAEYQAQEPEKRAQALYRYFEIGTFRQLQMEEVFGAGWERLTEIEAFWKDWINLLKTKSGDVEARLLQEAVLHQKGVEGLKAAADENAHIHPSLYLKVMMEYEKYQDAAQIEEIGEQAMEKMDRNLVIRSEVALKAAYASCCLKHTDKMMLFCWEAFCSDSTDRNLLRLFGTDEMAKQYGIRGKEVLTNRMKGNQRNGMRYWEQQEFRQNHVGEERYHVLKFYMGDFESVRRASKNPEGSLGWSFQFIPYGIRLILLYLYEEMRPSTAAKELAAYVGFKEHAESEQMMDFEEEIAVESMENGVSVFWTYFQRWKRYFPMEESVRENYLAWTEEIVHSRAEAIVAGQHRGSYGGAAALLAMVADVKESMGMKGAKAEIFATYHKKFPNHRAFRAEMKNYFGVD